MEELGVFFGSMAGTIVGLVCVDYLRKYFANTVDVSEKRTAVAETASLIRSSSGRIFSISTKPRPVKVHDDETCFLKERDDGESKA